MSSEAYCGAHPSFTEQNRTRSVLKRFISHTMTHNLLQKEDMIMINVDEDMSIMNTIDPQLHGKMGIVRELREDDCLVELLAEEKNHSYALENNFMYDTDDLLSQLEAEAESILYPAQRKLVYVPMFCMCLEDHVLKRRMDKT